MAATKVVGHQPLCSLDERMELPFRRVLVCTGPVKFDDHGLDLASASGDVWAVGENNESCNGPRQAFYYSLAVFVTRCNKASTD
jgi:hypothetical protein